MVHQFPDALNHGRFPLAGSCPSRFLLSVRKIVRCVALVIHDRHLEEAPGAVGLPRLVGNALAKELLFTSRVVDAEEAVRIGLANRVVPDGTLEAATAEMAEAIAKASPLALTWIKRVVDAATPSGDGPQLEHNSDLVLRGAPDHVTRFTSATNRITGRGGS